MWARRRPGELDAAGARRRQNGRLLRRYLLLALLPVLLLSLVVLPGPGGAAEQGDPPPQFQRAEGQRDWRFPRDHGQHPAYRLEWWYYTGIVRTAQGRVFGYQVTFFRQGLPSAVSERRSAWAVHSLYLAHVALSDIDARHYRHASRAGRDSLRLSGASRVRHEVWLGRWRAEPLRGDPHGVRLNVDTGDFALALTLHGGGPPVLHGVGGLDRKGAAAGQASWYYSQPKMATEGTVRVDGTAWPVTGQTWMDHEFGTSQLGAELAGWDWLALRLDDGSALMLYRLRARDGTAAPFSSGDWVTAGGARTALTLTAPGAGGTDSRGALRATFTPMRTWHSPDTGGDYPLGWRLELAGLPGGPLALRIEPAFDAQEQAAGPGTPFAYWEGAVWAEGTRGERGVRGEGYLELTGYAGALGGALR